MADFESIIKTHATETGEIPATAINALTTAIKNAVGNEYVEKERYKAKLTEIDNLKEKQQTAEDTAATAEKWKTKYDAMKADFDQYKQDQAAKETKAQKSEAYKAILKQAGIPDKRIDTVLRVSDLDSVKLDKDGNIEGADALLQGIKTEWADFIPQDGMRVDFGGSLQGGGKALTADEIMAIQDDAQRQEAILENHSLFGF